MSFRRFFMTILTAAALTGTSAWAQTITTTTVTQQANYPSAGLAGSETAQLNVMNLASNSRDGTAASCTGTISFLNSSGTAIGTATSFTVTSGKTFSLSMPYSNTGASGSRTEIRGVISVTVTSGAPCTLSSSFETYDTTSGVTHIYLANAPADLGGGSAEGGPVAGR
jgi:hypothetical protein